MRAYTGTCVAPSETTRALRLLEILRGASGAKKGLGTDWADEEERTY